MSLQQGGMTTEQMREYFGANAVSDNGRFVNEALNDDFINNEELKDYFVNKMGRDESHWGDGERDDNDMSAIMRDLHKGSTNEAAPTPEEHVEFSDELQQAHDRVNQWESDVWSGKQSQYSFGQSQTVADGSSNDLGKQQKNAAQHLANNYISDIKRDVEQQLTQGIKV